MGFGFSFLHREIGWRRYENTYNTCSTLHSRSEKTSHCSSSISVSKCRIFVLLRTGWKNSSVTRLWLKVWTAVAARRMSPKRAASSTCRRRTTSWSTRRASRWRPSTKGEASSPRTTATDRQTKEHDLLLFSIPTVQNLFFLTHRSPSYQGRTTKRPSGRRTPSDWGPDSKAGAGKRSACRRPSESAAPPPSEPTLVRVGSSSGGSSWACQSLQRRSCLEQDPGRTEGPSCVLATLTGLLEEAGGRTVNSEGSALFSPRRRTRLGMWSWGPSGKLSSAHSGKWVPRFCSRGVWPSVRSGYRRGYRVDAAAGTRSKCSLWSPLAGTWWWPASSRSWECERCRSYTPKRAGAI